MKYPKNSVPNANNMINPLNMNEVISEKSKKIPADCAGGFLFRSQMQFRFLEYGAISWMQTTEVDKKDKYFTIFFLSTRLVLLGKSHY